MDIKDVKDLRTIRITKEEYDKLGQINKYLTSDECEHLPLPPKKVMMQMWRNNSDDSLFSEESRKSFVTAEKIGEPYEFVFPEEMK